MKRYIALVILCLCGVVSAQKVIISPIVPGAGGIGSGGVTGQYVFNGPFTVTDVTNVFLNAILSNQVMTGISPGATNASAYIASINGFGTNTIFRQSTGPLVPLTISPLIGAVTNRFQVLNTNGVPVVLVDSNNLLRASNITAAGTFTGTRIIDVDFGGDKALISFDDGLGVVIAESGITGTELGQLSGVTINLAAKNNNVNLTTNIIGAGTVTVSSNNTGGWTITGSGGTATTTNLAAFSFAATPLITRTTNSWADGTNVFYTNVFNSVTSGLTNVYVTNMMEGSTIEMWLFPSNGVTVGFPQFAASDHLDGSVITPATNIWSRVKVTRRGSFTNILVTTKTFEINWGNIVATTNFVTGVITLSGGGSPAGSSGNVQFNLGGLFAGQNQMNWESNRNRFMITGTAAASTNAGRPSIVASNTVNGNAFVELNQDGLSGSGALLQFSLGAGSHFDGYGTNVLHLFASSLRPTVSNSMDLGSFSAPFRTNWLDAIDLKDTFRYRGSSPGSGKVLTSDANGVGTWQSPSLAGITRNDINGGTTATNLVIDGAKNFVLTNSLTVDVTYALSNAVDGAAGTISLLGQTNAANNHTVTLTAAQGCVINWQGFGTNSPATFILFSNATATVSYRVVTNQLGTNIIATMITDSYWPQPNAPLFAAAGASTSNYIAGGLVYYDYSPAAYTNIFTNGATALFYTNMAVWTAPAHILTNIGDSIKGVWRGGINPSRTNQFVVGFGTVTNVFDSGAFTNNSGAWELSCEITATGPTNQSIYTKLEVSGLTTLAGSMTNSQINFSTLGIITNGVTNVMRLQARSHGVGAISNNFFKVYYQPGIR